MSQWVNTLNCNWIKPENKLLRGENTSEFFSESGGFFPSWCHTTLTKIGHPPPSPTDPMGLSDKYMVSWFVHPSVGGNFTPHPPHVPKNPLVSRQSHCPNYHCSIPAPPNQLGLNKMYLFVFSRKCIYNFSDHAGMKFREYRENPKFTKFSRQYFRTIPTLPSVYFSQ